ncbi:MAG: nicotinate mononucleotide-dependent phosphoribosyltransferase CobT [Archaeoglobaceae archaeon]
MRELLNGDVMFLLVIGNTRTAEIPGITVAGANPELVKYTPPADAELLYFGRCLSIDGVPATPDGKPTPALISLAALRLTDVPFLVVRSGTIVAPKIPFVELSAPVGGNIAVESAMSREDVAGVIERAKILSKQLSKLCDVLMVGESIPAGTTTAAAVLKALGFKPAVSSSMPENPIELKMEVVEKAVGRLKSRDPLDVLAEVGDPVLAAVCGIALGSRKPVILAGGTQMVAAARLIESFGGAEIAIATTKYVANDRNVDLSIAPCEVFVADPKLGNSKYPGLRAYEDGFVKEGVGAGGLSLLCEVRGLDLLPEVERLYEELIQKR